MMRSYGSIFALCVLLLVCTVIPATADAAHAALMTLDEIKKTKDAEMVVLVDNDASRENVGRAVRSQGWYVENVSEEGEVYRMQICKSANMG